MIPIYCLRAVNFLLKEMDHNSRALLKIISVILRKLTVLTKHNNHLFNTTNSFDFTIGVYLDTDDTIRIKSVIGWVFLDV